MERLDGAGKRRPALWLGKPLFLSNSLWRVCYFWDSRRLVLPPAPPGFARTVKEITIHNRLGSETFNSAKIIQVVTGGKRDEAIL